MKLIDWKILDQTSKIIEKYYSLMKPEDVEKLQELFDSRSDDKFKYKGYGRIIVQKKEDIEKVKEIIKEMDGFEFDYLPSDLIGVVEENDLVYNGKFDIDCKKLVKICREKGINVLIRSVTGEEYNNTFGIGF